MLAKNAESALDGPGCQLIRQPRQMINFKTEFAKASQGPADEFIVSEYLLLPSDNLIIFFQYFHSLQNDTLMIFL